MKKFLATAISFALLSTMSMGLTACDACDQGGNVPYPPDAQLYNVTLKPVKDATAVGVANDGIDYYVVPEPAASAKTKSGELEIVGSLQELYGDTNGYPQAVVVAKKSLIESDGKFVSSFVSELSKNSAWLSSADTEISTIVGAINSNLIADYTGTLKAGNVTKTVISNCGIGYVPSQTCKEQVLTFMQKFNTVSPEDSKWGTPADSFFVDNTKLTSSSSSKSTISVYMPDGAPALALANMMANCQTIDGKTVNYTVVDASTIAARVNNTDMDKNADICVMPVNAASKLLGNGSKYQMLGTVTHGNLYLVANKGAEKITKENISSLNSKTIGVINLANVPGLTLKVILWDNNFTYVEE